VIPAAVTDNLSHGFFEDVAGEQGTPSVSSPPSVISPLQVKYPAKIVQVLVAGSKEIN
jgi:hypothetical protein